MQTRMEQTVRRSAPPDTKHIADNIAIAPVRSVDGIKLHEDEAAVSVGPTKDYFYAYFLEFGTVKMSARPFARAAFDSEQDSALTTLAGHLWKAISRAGSSRSTSGGTL